MLRYQIDLLLTVLSLQLKPLEKLMEIFASTTEAQELAAATSNDLSMAKEQLESALLEIAKAAGLPEITGGKLLGQFLPWGVGGHVWMWSVPYHPEGPCCAPNLWLLVSLGEVQPCKLHLIPIPVARCYTYRWDKDNFGKLGNI